MQLSIVTLGHVHEQDITALTPYCTRIEQLVLDINPRDPLTQHRAEFNRAIDASTNDWILIVRERETAGDALAKEIIDAATTANAWGFRIRTTPMYRGKPLTLPAGEGEIRLLHRRHYLKRADDVAVQGTVVRLNNTFHAITFESADAHRDYLAKSFRRRSTVIRALIFARDVIATRTFDANTLRYIWTEAAFAKP